jgi:5-methylcytosine-specific restriction endonuclease McrA
MKKCTVKGCLEDPVNSGKCRTHYNEYMKEYMLARYYRRQAEWREKLGGKCDVCGTTENLEFDHLVASDKALEIAKILTSGSNDKLAREMAKCHLLCKDHHLEKSIASGDINNVEHGGGLTGKKNCRCKLCAPLKNAYARELRRNKKQSIPV